MTTRRWTRSKPGNYCSGPYTIIGGGAAWNLYRQEKHIDCFTSKKAAQEHVERNPNAGVPQDPKPKQLIPDKDSLESILASLRLDVCRLTDMIGVLSTEIHKLSSNRG